MPFGSVFFAFGIFQKFNMTDMLKITRKLFNCRIT